MSTVKDEVRRILENLPDDTTYEDVQYHIYIRQKVEAGLRDLAEGRVVGEDEVDRRLTRWLEG